MNIFKAITFWKSVKYANYSAKYSLGLAETMTEKICNVGERFGSSWSTSTCDTVYRSPKKILHVYIHKNSTYSQIRTRGVLYLPRAKPPGKNSSQSLQIFFPQGSIPKASFPNEGALPLMKTHRARKFVICNYPALATKAARPPRDKAPALSPMFKTDTQGIYTVYMYNVYTAADCGRSKGNLARFPARRGEEWRNSLMYTCI